MEIDVRGFLHSKTEIQCLFEKQNSLNLIRELLERPFSIQINELTRKKSTISFNDPELNRIFTLNQILVESAMQIKGSYFANDISNLVSPEQYREHFYAWDARISEYLETPWMHVHSGGARLVREFVKLPRLRGIQIVNDRPAGPTAKDLVPVFKTIQEKHLLFLRKYSREELEEILPELSMEGLYVDTQADSEDEALRLLDWWNDSMK